MVSRVAYVITSADCPPDRLNFVKRLLATIGFDDVHVMERNPLYHPGRAGLAVLYEIIQSMIAGAAPNYVYMFDDSINKGVDLSLAELAEYEEMANGFFYLGIDKINQNKGIGYTGKTIYARNVYTVKGNVGSAHAFALSLQGALDILPHFATTRHKTIDLFLCAFCKTNATPVVRYDVQSALKGQRGAIFADLCQFNSELRRMF